MAISCNPEDLAVAAECFNCVSPRVLKAIRIRLLCAFLNDETMACDPKTLSEEAVKFFSSMMSPGQLDAIEAYLLCQIANKPAPSPTAGVPSGTILLWSGSQATIPTGYVLCDGNNSSPDLRDRFIVGAGSTYAVDATGGATTQTATLPPNGVNGDVTAGVDFNATSSAFSILPPYYALCYIMKT